MLLESDRKLVEAQAKVIQDRTKQIYLSCSNYAEDDHAAGM